MKKLITLLILAASFSAFGQYSGGGGVTSAQLATKLGTNAVVQTLSGDSSNDVPSVAAVNDGLDLKLPITDGTATNLMVVGTNTLATSGATTNYVTKVYTGGQLVITEVYNGTTNTYYDLTD